MKDFHDLYSLILLGVLDSSLAEKAVHLVFCHRNTLIKKLPIVFGKESIEMLEKNWTFYLRKLKEKQGVLQLPDSIEEVIAILNQWLEENVSF